MDQLLVYRKGQLLGRYELHAMELVIGRGGHIVLDAPDVSRLHAILSYADGTWTVTDLGSLNGLTVNGESATSVELKQGDRMGVGGFELKCEFKGPAPTLRAPPLVAREGLEETHVFEASRSPTGRAVSLKAPRPSGPSPILSDRTLEHAALSAVVSQASSMSLRRSQIIHLAAMPIAEAKPDKKTGEKVAERLSGKLKSPEATRPDVKKPADAPAPPADAAPAAAAVAAPPADEKAEKKPEAEKKPDAPEKKPEAEKPKPPAKKVEAKRESVGEDVRKAYERYFVRLRRLVRRDVDWQKDAKPTQVDLTYMRRKDPRRRRVRAAWVLAVLASGAWIGISAARGDRMLYTGGSLSRGHTLFGDDCQACHVAPFRLHVPDPACLACHRELLTEAQTKELDGLLKGEERLPQFHPLDPALEPVMAKRWATHHQNEKGTPACAMCHPEHEGHSLLTWQVGDRDCLTCHRDLGKWIEGGPAKAEVVTVAGLSIPGLAQHPEIAPLGSDVAVLDAAGTPWVPKDSSAQLLAFGPQTYTPKDGLGGDLPGRRDRARVYLNHARHLRRDENGSMGSMDGTPERKAWVEKRGREYMTCDDCHVRDEGGALLRPIKYDQHCAACHPLGMPTMVAASGHPDAAFVNSHSISRPLPLPHGMTGQAVVAFARGADLEGKVKAFYADYIAAHEDELKPSGGGGGGPRRPGQKAPAAAKPLTPEEWVERRFKRWQGEGGVGQALYDLLFSQNREGCIRCHSLEHPEWTGILRLVLKGDKEPVEGRFKLEKGVWRGQTTSEEDFEVAQEQVVRVIPVVDPSAIAEEQRNKVLEMASSDLGARMLDSSAPSISVVEPHIPARWLEHVRFDHASHATVRCEDCHTQARTSVETQDVLLPRMEACQKCHAEGPLASCVTCHPYHDRDPSRPGSQGRLGRDTLVRRK